MPPIVSDALVLRTYALGESSKVVVLLTRERGKVRAVARGVRGGRPRYQSALEPMSEVRVGLHGRQGAGLFRLGQCELVSSAFRAGERGLEAALQVGYFAELFDAFAQEGEADDATYRLAVAALAALKEGSDVMAVARYVEAWLLRLHGLYPSLEACASCARPLDPARPLAYHRSAHGFVCEACGPASGPELSPPAARFLRDAQRRPPRAMTLDDAADQGGLEAFHRDLIRAHLERDLRSVRVLRDVARGGPR
jgi:DNA repair protein RecO (recombination protein O)